MPITVLLEFEWVTRALYGFGHDEFSRVVEHLVGLPNVNVEDWPVVVDALTWHLDGLDFADALHVARSGSCSHFFSFDDRGFGRRARKLGVTPPVSLPPSK